jgi:hypothetical protein
MNSAVLTASLTGRIQFFCCVALLRVTQPLLLRLLRPARDASIPPLLYGDPWASPGTRPDRLRGVGSRVRAPRALDAPGTATPGRCPSNLRWRSGRPRADGGARPSRSASELLGSHSPCRIPCHRRLASRRPRDPYPPVCYCRLHASCGRAGELTRCARTSHTFPWR